MLLGSLAKAESRFLKGRRILRLEAESWSHAFLQRVSPSNRVEERESRSDCRSCRGPFQLIPNSSAREIAGRDHISSRTVLPGTTEVLAARWDILPGITPCLRRTFLSGRDCTHSGPEVRLARFDSYASRPNQTSDRPRTWTLNTCGVFTKDC